MRLGARVRARPHARVIGDASLQLGPVKSFAQHYAPAREALTLALRWLRAYLGHTPGSVGTGAPGARSAWPRPLSQRQLGGQPA